MGSLDPKLDKERTFALLEKRGAISAVLTFSGGNDEGYVEKIELTLGTGEKEELEVWHCGGYRMGDKNSAGYYDWQPISKPENESQELSELLQGPIDEEFGSWGGVDYTAGTLTWDVATREATMSFNQSRTVEVEEHYSF